jgi:tRNA(Ile)-lysidine synthase
MPQLAHSDPARNVADTLAQSLKQCVAASEEVLVVALSGGRDSMVLLDGLKGVARSHGRRVVAVHVHHGLSPHADDWARFCTQSCAARDIQCVVVPITVPQLPQASLENTARRLRYAALAQAALTAGARVVALAHQRDDQAETVLLQLLRGAGPHGLAGMPVLRSDPRGVTWWRPLLALPRKVIDEYACATGLAWIDDESNARPRHRRNAVRHVVRPALAVAGFAQVDVLLARAAAHQADALLLVDDLAALDAQGAFDGCTLDRALLARLPPHRGRNLLRWFLRQRGYGPPPGGRLRAMLAQLTSARADAQVRIAHDGAQVGLYRGRIHLHPPPPAALDLPWHGEPVLALPHGALVFAHGKIDALDERRLAEAPVRVRVRRGGERFQLSANRPRRALKSILQERGMPPWERRSLPLLFCGDELAAVPGLGVDVAFKAPPGFAGVTLSWYPDLL